MNAKLLALLELTRAAHARFLGDAPGHDFHGNQWGPGQGSIKPKAEWEKRRPETYDQFGGSTAITGIGGDSPNGFDPTRIGLLTPKGRPTAQQAQKLHDALVKIDGWLHDPEIGMAMFSALGAMTPRDIQDRIKAMESGRPQRIYGGKGDVQLIKHVSKALASNKVEAALNELFQLMADKETGPAVQKMVMDIILAGGIDKYQATLRTAGGAGSGNFGHAGRPGEIGGSSGAGGMEPWKSAGGFADTGITWKQPTDPTTGRPIPIKVKTVEEAAVLVNEGKVVEVPDVKTAYSLINKLSDMALEAKAAGKDAKDYDLCQVSVAGTNMFCAESLRTKEYPSGVPRLDMPQLGGQPVPGSEADKLPRNKWDNTEVDGSKEFVSFLKGVGIHTDPDVVPAANLRASQRELIGSKVAKMIVDKSFDPAKNPVFVSSDGYVVDGHHRWAAVVGRDAEDGKLGDSKINVVRVNATISEVLHLANSWSKRFGIKQVAGVK